MTSEQAVGRLLEALERQAVPYMLVGAFSSNLYGVPRATNDADVVIASTDVSLKTLCDGLGEDFTFDPQMMIEGFTGTVRNVITYVPTGFQVEVFRVGTDPHHLKRFDRRQRRQVPECSCEAWVAAADDVVIQKLRWGRRKDLDDVVSLLAVSADLLDWGYLREWTSEHGTHVLLDQLCVEAGIRPS